MQLLIEQFLNFQTDIKDTTKANYQRILNIFAKFHHFRSEISETDILSFINSEYFRGLEISSQNRYKTVLKKFTEFLGLNAEFIRKKKEIQKELNKEQLLTPGEVQGILDRMSRNLDKCLFMVLLEGKIRIGEAQMLQIRDFTDKGTHYNMYIRKSKTAQRTIPLVSAVPYIVQYLNNHPLKHDPSAPFFVRKYDGQIKEYTISGLRQIITRNADSIPKRIYPHLLRHTGLTNSAKFLSDSLLMELAGWRTRGMVSRYVHLASDDLEDKVLELHGIIPEKEKGTIRVVENKECPRCQFINPGVNMFCSRCGSALELETVLKAEENIRAGEKALSKEELFELFVKWLKKE